MAHAAHGSTLACPQRAWVHIFFVGLGVEVNIIGLTLFLDKLQLRQTQDVAGGSCDYIAQS